MTAYRHHHDHEEVKGRGGSPHIVHSSIMTTTGPRQLELEREALRRFLLEMVGLVYEVPLEQLLSSSRGKAPIALARQVAMYLAHTLFGLSLSEAGRLFGRDRTTIAHGCALVEDMRDDPAFDRLLGRLERALASQLEMFRWRRGGDGQ